MMILYSTSRDEEMRERKRSVLIMIEGPCSPRLPGWSRKPWAETLKKKGHHVPFGTSQSCPQWPPSPEYFAHVHTYMGIFFIAHEHIFKNISIHRKSQKIQSKAGGDLNRIALVTSQKT